MSPLFREHEVAHLSQSTHARSYKGEVISSRSLIPRREVGKHFRKKCHICQCQGGSQTDTVDIGGPLLSRSILTSKLTLFAQSIGQGRCLAALTRKERGVLSED